ncbi:MAG: hypothetical protein A2W91_10960 [Bacteroidetes bacterium GWF2_38_335]|nr:MAG: hypothetical protein A2W91_10960 [Bacteroidetes bacterium GWF2_38_335]OFY81779.1 MAG: hypothetical protein A2281_06080 [Bacteroidetes bacterium RIFOXYA12_FULL_38_20]HBS87849.1 hypothetical protein [Bacteroidales bacterium]
MKVNQILINIVCVVLFVCQAHSEIPQNKKLSKPDSLHMVVEDLVLNNPEDALKVALEEINISERGTEQYVNALNDAGKSSYYMDEYEKALFFLENALVEATRIDYKKGKADVFFYIGDIYILMGKYGAAIDYLAQGMSLYEKIKDNTGKSNCLNGLGLIQMYQGNYSRALDYFKKALESGDAITKGDSYTYMGELFVKMEAFEEAIKYASMSLEAGRKNQDLYVMSSSLDNLGIAYLNTGKNNEAVKLFRESMLIKEELGDRQGLALTLINIGSNFKSMNQKDSALYYFRKAYLVSSTVGAKKEIGMAALEYSKILASSGFYDSAFIIQNRYIEVVDEISNENALKKIAELEAGYESDKQKQKITLLEKEQEFEARRKQDFIYIGISLLLLFIALVLFIWSRYRMKKKTAEALELKNQIIEEKNRHITDSIQYAKHIQEAILPPVSYIKKQIPDLFIIYLPKDIVAGDFYWFNQVENKIGFAVCDCTGHGVPGAMVSVMCCDFLNRAFKEMEIFESGKVLDHVADMVVDNFKKGENEVKDGMDASLCVFNPDLKTLQWSGANNALWIIRNGSSEIEEIRPSKQPVGMHPNRVPFLSNNLKLETGDILYMFTDGFADQFGGDSGKKFKSIRFKELLISVKDHEMEKQKEIILKTFSEWKGNITQVDDVCVAGIRI